MRLRGSRCSARKRLMRSARMGVGSGHLCGGRGTPRPQPPLTYALPVAQRVLGDAGLGDRGEQPVSPVGPPQDPPRPCCPAVPSPTWCTLTIERVGAGSRPSCSRTATCARCSSNAGATATGSPKLCPNQAPPSITYTALVAPLAPPRSSLSPPLHPQLLTVNRTEAAPVLLCWGKATES